MTSGERIRALREKRGISQVDFANQMGVSKQTLYKYENNIVTNIPFDKIEMAAKIGNVSPAFLMGWHKPDEKGKEGGKMEKVDELIDVFAQHIKECIISGGGYDREVEGKTKALAALVSARSQMPSEKEHSDMSRKRKK